VCACARKNREKTRKSPETAFPGDLTACLIFKNISKTKREEEAILLFFGGIWGVSEQKRPRMCLCRFFEKMRGSALDFFYFGSML
jgi:hypothetical protein